MQDKFNLLGIQNALGYTFKNAELIKTAFVHKAYVKANAENNTKAVFLGKKLLDLLICDYVCSHSAAKSEKQLHADFDTYITALAPEKFIKKHSLAEYVIIDSLNEPMRDSDTLRRELFYAIVAAIYKDGGLPALKGFLMPMLRCVGDTEHYEPSLDGKVESRADAALSSEKRILNAKIRLGAKPSAISVSKAPTVNNQLDAPSANTDAVKKPEEKPKKEKGLSKLLKKMEKEQKAPAEDAQLSVNESAPSEKRFIRDPFAPVKLSDDLRNFKPKKSPKSYESSPAPITDAPAVTQPSEPTLDDNHKSLLQETVQRNIRTASVLIKYMSKPQGKNQWTSSVTLSDKVIGVGKGENKKSAEKAAASAAYNAIKTNGTEENKYFLSLCTGEVADTAQAVDYVSKINQYFQKTKHLSSAPVTYEKRHSGQKNVFATAVIYEGREIAIGKGSTPKEAKQNAARVACDVLKIK